jgi:hypothetical protein
MFVLAEQIFRSYNVRHIGLPCTRADEVMLIPPSHPVWVDLVELLSNCLKHAFPDEGEIRSSYIDCGTAGTAIVRDTGIGFAGAESFPPGRCLQLVHSLTEQLGGTLNREQRWHDIHAQLYGLIHRSKPSSTFSFDRQRRFGPRWITPESHRATDASAKRSSPGLREVG